MKKLLFAAVSMEVGGIEKALLTLLNYLVETNKYEITLVLEKRQGVFLDKLNSKIKVIEYSPNNFKIVPIRKIINCIKRIKFTLKYKNKFDFSASFATYSKMASFVSRTASTNNALWGHANYLELYKGDEKKVKEFFEEIHYKEFKRIIFVANKAKEEFIKVFPEMKERTVFCNNLINYKEILELSNEEIKEEKNVFTFVNVSRHDENQKKLTRIINASKKLEDEGFKFKLLFIGEGLDTKLYKDKVQQLKLENTIKFVGAKNNPYSYINNSDAVILSSDYEGYPVIFLEALVLNKPIITTDISDALQDIDGKFGKVVKKDENEIYLAMKDFIENGYMIKEKFNPDKYNNEIISKLEKIIN